MEQKILYGTARIVCKEEHARGAAMVLHYLAQVNDIHAPYLIPLIIEPRLKRAVGTYIYAVQMLGMWAVGGIMHPFII